MNPKSDGVQKVRLTEALQEIIRIEETRIIPDRHGRDVHCCNETCLIECAALAKSTLKALEQA